MTDADFPEPMNPHTETIAVLDAVRDVLSNPDRWTKFELARSRLGDPVEPDDPSASCWCLQGAISRVVDDSTTRNAAHQELRVTLALRDRLINLPLIAVEYNDQHDTTHADILKLIDDTIRRLRENPR